MDMTAINLDFVKSITFNQETKSTKYRLLHKKGEMRKVFKWRKLMFVDEPFEDDVVYYVDWWGDGVICGSELLASRHYFIKGNDIYLKSNIEIHYKDGKIHCEYYDDQNEALSIYKLLVKEKNLAALNF